jgi:hypothetical protein
MNKLNRLVLASVAVATLATASSGVAFAKGGSGGGGGGGGGNAFVPTTTGDCANVTTTADNTFVYPLSNPNFPGSVAVTINYAGTPFATSICLEDGWAVQYQTVSNGFQANFTYNGQKAIDMKYELGKTDIRNY